MEYQERNQLITLYFNIGLHHREILSFLLLRHNICISERHLKRILKQLNLWRRKKYSNLNSVYQFVEAEVQGSGRLHGYRWMHLKCLQHGFVVTQHTIRLLLQMIDPVGVAVRKRKRLRRRQYQNKGPNYLWHVDSYDKLKPYEIAINGCIDGYSRYIVWLKAAYTSNDPRVISGYYVNAVKSSGGCPKTLRTDMGTENRHIEQIQIFFRSNDHENPGLPPFIYGTSTHNQRIEAWWSVLRKQKAQFWMNIFEQLKNGGHFDGAFLDKALIQFCFLDIIQRELNQVVLEWNSHKISKSRNSRAPVGKPIMLYNLPELYGTEDYLVELSNDDICATLDECLFLKEYVCDEDVFNLCNIIVEENGYSKPRTPYEAVTLYVNLRREILSLL